MSLSLLCRCRCLSSKAIDSVDKWAQDDDTPALQVPHVCCDMPEDLL